jgi:ABC-type dipeptide/oligopeptide/nickel transport system permease subunit
MTDSPQDLLAPRPIARDNPFTRSAAGVIGFIVLGVMVLACLLSLPHTLAAPDEVSYLADGAMVRTPGSPRYDFQDRNARQLPPSWWSRSADAEARARVHAVATARAMAALAKERRTSVELLEAAGVVPAPEMVGASAPFYLMGTDLLGRDLFVRCLAGGGISLTIGIAAAVLSVLLGTVYGAVSGYIGGRLDAFLMRVVDILYGLPYILLVVLLAVAVDSVVQNVETARVERAAALKTAYVKENTGGLPDGGRTQTAIEAIKGEASRIYGSGELSNATVQAVNIVTLLVAIGGVSWLTMARVVRGQVLSLKSQPFMEAARAMGVPLRSQFSRHLLPNLMGPITVYATLTVPQAILQESFLSFLGIGVHPPLPSWGNLAADGLQELNGYKSNWWLLAFPCVLLGVTLLALNFVGEGLREAMDPKRARR